MAFTISEERIPPPSGTKLLKVVITRLHRVSKSYNRKVTYLLTIQKGEKGTSLGALCDRVAPSFLVRYWVTWAPKTCRVGLETRSIKLKGHVENQRYDRIFLQLNSSLTTALLLRANRCDDPTCTYMRNYLILSHLGEKATPHKKVFSTKSSA